MHERFAGAHAPQWDALMMRCGGDDLVARRRRGVQRDALASAANFNAAVLLTHPDVLACVLPRHRVAAATPCHIRIASNSALLIVAMRIGRPSIDWLQLLAV